MTLRVALAAIARPTFDISYAQAMTDAARQSLRAAGLEVLGTGELVETEEEGRALARGLKNETVDLLVLFQSTFADSTMTMRLAEASPAPLVLWAVPEPHTGGRLRLNSLCGVNLAAHALTRAGIAYETVFAPPDDAAAAAQIETLARAGRVKRLLAQARLGRVGEHPAGFETCEPDAAALKRFFGVDLVQIDLRRDVFDPARETPPAAVDPLFQTLGQRLSAFDALDPDPTRRTLAVYRSLTDLAQRQNIQAFAVRCWPEFFTELGCAACGAASLLNDALIPASCEADVNGALSELILQEISGEPAFGADVVSLDVERDALVLWHCGKAPLSMADTEQPIAATIHSNRKLPLLMDFDLKPGRVTVARISHATGNYRLVLGGGEIVRGPKAFSGTSGYLRFDHPAQDVLDAILAEGLEHHTTIVYGEHRPALYALARMLHLPILDLTPANDPPSHSLTPISHPSGGNS